MVESCKLTVPFSRPFVEITSLVSVKKNWIHYSFCSMDSSSNYHLPCFRNDYNKVLRKNAIIVRKFYLTLGFRV